MRHEIHRHGLLWVALGASLWGTDTLFRRSLPMELPSARIVLLEHLVLCVALAPFAWRGRHEWMKLGARGWAAVLGIAWGGSALASVLFTEAVRAGNPTSAVLLQKTQPVFAALLAGSLLLEPLGRRFWGVLAAALGGAYLVSFGMRVPSGVEGRAAVLALAAAALWGGSTVLGRFVLGHVSWLTLTALRIFVATPLLVALAAGTEGPVSGRSFGIIVTLAAVPGLLALLAYYRGLAGSPASRAAIAELAFPATAALLNWIFLGARVEPAQVAGFTIIWLAIVCLDSARA